MDQQRNRRIETWSEFWSDLGNYGLSAGLGDLAFESAAFFLNERPRTASSDLAPTTGCSG